MTICKRTMGTTLTKYDAVEMVLDCLGCPATLAYLRDLKASHDRLLEIGQKYTGHLGSCSVFYEELCDCGFADSTDALKAAEALR